MKFLLGMLMGVVIGMLCLISAIAAFFAGLALGWKAFNDESDESPTSTEETPAT